MYLTFRANIGTLVIVVVSGESFLFVGLFVFLMSILFVTAEEFRHFVFLIWNKREDLKTHHF